VKGIRAVLCGRAGATPPALAQRKRKSLRDASAHACAGADRGGCGAQVTQARCYQAAISYWRRIKTEPDARTMGVLYWQVRRALWARAARRATGRCEQRRSPLRACGGL
jgi:hypothetical protein